MNRLRRHLMLVALMWTAVAADAADKPERVIIMGFDGADAAMVERLMAAGKLPNLARLKATGIYARLATTNPAQSPTAWASFSTGMNPGKTNIFGFLRRGEGRYAPELAMIRRGEKPFWSHPLMWLAIAGGIGMAAGLIALAILVLGRKLRGGPVRVSALGATTAVGVLFLATFAVSMALLAWLPRRVPAPVSNRRGSTLWQLVDRHAGHGSGKGPAVMVLFAPVAFPPDRLDRGELLSGLGVPDLRRMPYSWRVYDSAAPLERVTETGGRVLPARQTAPGVYEATSFGPPNLFVEAQMKMTEQLLSGANGNAGVSPDELRRRLHKLRDQLEMTRPVRFERAAGSAGIHFAGAVQTVKIGAWSDFFRFEYKMSYLVRLHGMTRFYVQEAGDELRVYQEPIQIDPAAPPPILAISSPPDYCTRLEARYGPFKTLGWATATHPVKDGELEDAAFVADVKLNLRRRETMLLGELDRLKGAPWRLAFGYFETPDRIQHVLWRHIDPRHPKHDPAQAKRFGPAIDEAYAAMDAAVGKVLDRHVDERTTLIVLSDHGMAPFRRAVNLNTWLAKQGYLAPKGRQGLLQLDDLFGGDLFSNVDFSRTRAYSLGLGKVFINLRGREPNGIVEPGEYDGLVEEICRKLEAMRDPADLEAPVVRKAYRRDEAMHGKFAEGAADIFLGFARGYRVSWQTCLGGIPAEVFEDNMQNWSADHCSVDPGEVPGVLFASRKLPGAAGGGASILDVAPTVLSLLGIPAPPEMDGADLSKPR